MKIASTESSIGQTKRKGAVTFLAKIILEDRATTWFCLTQNLAELLLRKGNTMLLFIIEQDPGYVHPRGL